MQALMTTHSEKVSPDHPTFQLAWEREFGYSTIRLLGRWTVNPFCKFAFWIAGLLDCKIVRLSDGIVGMLNWRTVRLLLVRWHIRPLPIDFPGRPVYLLGC